MIRQPAPAPKYLAPPGTIRYVASPMDPLVSVLMPVRDAAATLGAAIDSVRAQTLAAWELIAVDDGSSDGSLELLRSVAVQDVRLRVVQGPPRGIVAALNEGLRLARAPLIARMDADDLSLPDRLEAQVRLLDSRPELGLASCLVECFPAELISDGMRHYEAWLNGLVEPEQIAVERLVESPLVHPSVLARRSVLTEYRDGPFPEDYDLWLRMHEAGVRMAKVPRVLLRWRDGDGRLTRTDPRYGASGFLRLKAAHLARTFLRDRRAVRIWGAGPDGKRWRPILAEVGIAVAGFFDIDPRKIGGRVGRQVPVLSWERVPELRDTPLIVAVGAKGARAQIREALLGSRLREGADWLFVQ